ncbi:MAG: glycosyltransferase family 87 protein, partial [Pseudomonadota bacterium]
MTRVFTGESWLKRVRIPLLIYVVCLAGYMGASSNRLAKASNDNHYVYLADCLLKGRLSLEGAPPHQNDWAQVVELTLKDGRKLRGSFLKTGAPNRFKTTHKERMTITPDQIRERHEIYYVSFPWLPALLMLPFVAIFGLKFNDVVFTVVLAAFNPVLVYWVLRRLSALKLSARSLGEDLWLVLMFAFGTVYFYSSVMGQVWYTAHIIGVGITCLYVLVALEGKHPFWAGVCLGLGFLVRTPIPFIFPLVVGEILRRHLRDENKNLSGDLNQLELWPKICSLWHRIQWRPTIRDGVWLSAPVIFVALVAFGANYLRFDNPFEFGHTYLNVVWA